MADRGLRQVFEWCLSQLKMSTISSTISMTLLLQDLEHKLAYFELSPGSWLYFETNRLSLKPVTRASML